MDAANIKIKITQTFKSLMPVFFFNQIKDELFESE